MAKTWNINIPAQVNEDDRKALGKFLGKRGPATLAECRRFIYHNGIQALNELVSE